MKLPIAAITLLMTSLTLCGCKQIDLGLGQLQQVIDQLAALRYPDQAQLGDDLDIIVIRDGAAINLVNRTPRAYVDHQIWLNRHYVTQAAPLNIGSENWLALSRFINRHGESFPIGALLAPDKARPLISADLYNPDADTRHRLVVRFSDN